MQRYLLHGDPDLRQRARIRPGAGRGRVLRQAAARYHGAGSGAAESRNRRLRRKPRRRNRRAPNKQPAAAPGECLGSREPECRKNSISESWRCVSGSRCAASPDLKVHAVATLARAEPGSLSFLANSRYRRQLESTRATAVVVSAEDAAHCPVASLIHPNPYLAYARIATLMHPTPAAAPGSAPERRHRTSRKDRSLRAHRAVGGDRGRGRDRRARRDRSGLHRAARRPGWGRLGLVSRVNLYPGVSLGERCILHAGAVVGADGFGFAPNPGSWVKVPQVGSVQIGDDVEIGANTTIDRGAIDDTVVENGVKAGQSDPGGPQRAHRRPYGDRGLHRHFRQHDDRPALHDRRHGGICGTLDHCR